jgi:hypothetical protein
MSPHDEHRNGPIEEIHLPSPSLVPMFTAIGLALGLIGLILAWPIVAVGGLIALVSVVKWIRDVRQDIEHMPSGSGDRR